MIIPALDLLDGFCVRLKQGDFRKSTIYRSDPLEVAEGFIKAGVEFLHLVDLNAAKGEGSNREIIKDIRKKVACGIQVGGGIREEEDVKALVLLGVERLILGTVFILQPERVEEWASRYKVDFYAALDADKGKVKTQGWQADGGLSVEDAALLARKTGMAGIVYTDISRDGMLCGPDTAGALRLAEVSQLPVIISGGVSGMADIEQAAPYFGQGIAGIIVGKALYEGALDLQEALQRVKNLKKERSDA